MLSMVIEAGRALVIAFNKWDLVDNDRRKLSGEGDRARTRAGAVGAPGQHLGEDRPGGAEAGARAGDLAGVLGPAITTGQLNVSSRDRRRHPAASAGRQAAPHPVRHPSHRAPTDVRAVHDGFPGGRLPAVPGAPAARDVRLRGHTDRGSVRPRKKRKPEPAEALGTGKGVAVARRPFPPLRVLAARPSRKAPYAHLKQGSSVLAELVAFCEATPGRCSTRWRRRKAYVGPGGDAIESSGRWDPPAATGT